MSCCSSCGTNGNWASYGGCCPTCQPANVAIRGECQDPGTLTTLRFVSGLDHQFCPGRLASGSGVLNAVINGSGNSVISWTNTPKIDPETVTATEDTAFGSLLVLGSDNKLRQLEVPVTPSLVMQTDGAGNLILSAVPAATVPDPLNVNDLGVANQATIEDLEVNGTVEVNNLAAGTAVNLLALNASNQVILQGLAQGLSISMFFESPTSPAAGTPNAIKVSGDYLTIGNRLFDSGGDNITVTTSESLTVQDAGTYLILWAAQVRTGGAAAPIAGVWLEVNGTIVNYGNGRTSGVSAGAASTPVFFQLAGMDVRTYAANDVLKLQLNATATVLDTYEVRLIAIRLP